MDVVADILEKTSGKSAKYKTIAVEKHLDVDYDVGGLLVFDPNEVDRSRLT